MPSPDETQAAIADRLTLEKVAASYNELMDIMSKQRLTQAQLIRWCLATIDKPAPSYVGAINTHRELREATAKLKADKALAREALAWLADKLEGKDVPDLNI